MNLNKIKKGLISLDEKGASIIETLVALGFIAFVSASFISLAITSRKIAFRHRVQNDLGRYAGMIAEEIVKDYTLSNVENDEYYCDAGSEIGNLVSAFRNTFDNTSCSITTVADGNYKIVLGAESFGKPLTAERSVILK